MAFLDLLIAAHVCDRNLTVNDIVEEVDTFMFEGHDTVATNIAFCLFLLANHPEVQEKVGRELEEIFEDDPDRAVEFQDLAKMKYLELCVKESLRLFPSIPVMSRCLDAEVLIDGYKIPRGTNIIMLNYHLHRDPDTFRQPNMFKPERMIGLKQNFSFTPFSAGPRNCIGQKFAMMEIKIIISTILRHFKLQPISEENSDININMPLLAELVLRPKFSDALKIRLTRI